MRQAEIKTTLGTLSAHVRDDPGYPGIDIRLEREGKAILLAWVEVKQTEQPPVLMIHLYPDCKDEEPSFSVSITESALNAYFKSLAEGALELV